MGWGLCLRSLELAMQLIAAPHFLPGKGVAVGFLVINPAKTERWSQ